MTTPAPVQPEGENVPATNLIVNDDRLMLNYLHQAFQSEVSVCERCHHEEPTAEYDSAIFLREYLASHPTPPAGEGQQAAPSDAEILEVGRSFPTLVELLSRKEGQLHYVLSVRAIAARYAGSVQEPVAWRHSLTGCLYETEEEVPLADGDEWTEPLYTHPAPLQSEQSLAAAKELLGLPHVPHRLNLGDELNVLGTKEAIERVKAMAEQPAASAEPEWIDDPHDIEQGMMRNPKYRTPVAAQPAQRTINVEILAPNVERVTVTDIPANPAHGKKTGATLNSDVAKVSQPAQDEREAFESWCISAKLGRVKFAFDYSYTHKSTRAAWQAWQTRAALSAPPLARQQWIEEACALIKSADDAAADNDYMLDSDDCIKVLRGEWQPDAAIAAMGGKQSG